MGNFQRWTGEISGPNCQTSHSVCLEKPEEPFFFSLSTALLQSDREWVKTLFPPFRFDSDTIWEDCPDTGEGLVCRTPPYSAWATDLSHNGEKRNRPIMISNNGTRRDKSCIFYNIHNQECQRFFNMGHYHEIERRVYISHNKVARHLAKSLLLPAYVSILWLVGTKCTI